MHDVRCGNPAVEDRCQPIPRQRCFLTAATKNSPPQPTKTSPENTELIEVARNGMVLVITRYNLSQPFTDRRDRLMHPVTQLCFDELQLCDNPLVRRLSPDDEGPVAPSTSTIVRETEEREGFGFSL